jgi:2-oxoglutarate ferredoxin oxidoreductase subunit beta
MHDGSVIKLRKLDHDYNPGDLRHALDRLEVAHVKGLFYTGLLFVDEGDPPLQDRKNLCDTPLSQLSDEDLRPKPGVFEEIMAGFRP